MSQPPRRADLHDLIASTDPKLSDPARPRQSPWGESSQPRRGLPALNTRGATGNADSRGLRSLNSPTWGSSTPSPWGSVGTTNRQNASRNTSSAPIPSSSFQPFQGVQQQPDAFQLLSSPRSSATTPFPTSTSASSAPAQTTASSGGGGGSSGSGGGLIRSGNFSPASSHGLNSPTNTGFERSPFSAGGSTSSSAGQNSVSKITVTQIFLLLGSITEKEGKPKWDTQAEAIRKASEDLHIHI